MPWKGVLLGFLLAVSAGDAGAHKTSLARTDVAVAAATVTWSLTVSAHDLAVALGIETDLASPVPRAAFEERAARLGRYVAQRLAVSAQGARCAGAIPEADYAALPDDVVVRIVFRCPAPVRRLSLSYRLFFDIDPRHRGLGRVTTAGGIEEFLFDRFLGTFETAVAHPPPATPWAARFARIVFLGIEHILTGYDHVLFLLALLMASVRLWDLVKVVTAFTVAHSVTLALAWYGVLDLPSRLVESLIALSIAYVAAENLFGRGFGHRWMLAFGFGLVHGLGFFGALSQLDLAGDSAVTVLLGFNLGVEVGQLAIVGIFCGLLAWSARRAWYGGAARAVSVLIMGVAGYWVVERVFLG